MDHRVPMIFVMFAAFAAVPITICLVVVWRHLRLERARRAAALRGELPPGDRGFDVFPQSRGSTPQPPRDARE